MTKHSNRDHSYSNHHKLHMPLCLLSNVIKDRVTVPGSFLFRISYMNTMFWSNLSDIPYPTASSLSLIKIFLPNFMCSFFKLNSSSVHGCRIIYSSMGSLSVATSLRKLTFPPPKAIICCKYFFVCVCVIFWGEVMSVFPIHSGNLVELITYGLYIHAFSHSCYLLVCTITL